ncbi:MAG: hypothetical protein MMC23_008569 [Stictis urceolatum]|nr:hypothetical protein [Stictis urceolata]
MSAPPKRARAPTAISDLLNGSSAFNEADPGGWMAGEVGGTDRGGPRSSVPFEKLPGVLGTLKHGEPDIDCNTSDLATDPDDNLDSQHECSEVDEPQDDEED